MSMTEIELAHIAELARQRMDDGVGHHGEQWRLGGRTAINFMMDKLGRHIAAGQQGASIASQWWKRADETSENDPISRRHAMTLRQCATELAEHLATPQPPKPADLCANCAADGRCMKRQALCVANGTADAKPAGAVPLPEPDGCLIADGEQLVFSKTRPAGVLARDVYGRAKLHRYGDAREAAAQHHVNLLGQAITDAAHKAGITRADAVIDGPMLLMLCKDLAEAAGRADAVPALDSVLRERGLPTVADALGYSRNFAAANPALSQTTRDHIEGLCNMLEIAANHPAPAPQPMTTQGEAVAEVYERFSCKRDQLGDSYRESEGPALRFTGEPLPVGTKLYTGSQP